MKSGNKNYIYKKHYRYKEKMHPLTNEKMWSVKDVSLASGGLTSLVEEFIDQYNYPDYSLSVYDNVTGKTIEIDCDINNIPEIVDYIYHLVKGTPLTFIGLNSLTESYVVGMSFCEKNINFGIYKYENKKLNALCYL